MKRLAKIYRKLVVALLFMATLSSCTDFLTIIPPDQVVHEDFWHTKDEVNGMLATAYVHMIGSDAMGKAIVWGELRSDNMLHQTENNEYQKIVEANITEENSFCRWSAYYKAINNANLVIEYAPLVIDRDPDFSEGDLKVVTGEMLALRALCHFYLVRAFRDIPLALVPAANDAELPDYAQVHPLEALNKIMEDLDRAEGMVMPSGSFRDASQNLGRITKNAVLAIKADVNLWRAAFATYYSGKSDLVKDGDIQNYYDQCIQDCRDIIKSMDLLLEKKWSQNNSYPDKKRPYNLLWNEEDVEEITKSKRSTIYDDIFGVQNSEESIFELQVTYNNVSKGGTALGNMYGYGNDPGALVAPQGFQNTYEKDDLRRYCYTNESASTSNDGDDKNKASKVTILKYILKSSPASSRNFRQSNNFDSNWIVYRKADVLLMMAEALAARASSTTADFEEAFDIVNAINLRSRIDEEKPAKALKKDDYLSSSSALGLVLDERKRELAFEGKRWFDLVRKALREKNTNGILFVADKLSKNSSAVKIKMSSIDGLFMPIHVDEIRFNKLLKQNPAYKKEDSSINMN